MLITKKLSRLACAIGATTVLSACLISTNAAASEKIRWQVPLAFPSHLIGLTTPVKHLSDSLKAVSGGDIQLRYYEPGELVPGWHQTLTTSHLLVIPWRPLLSPQRIGAARAAPA